MLLNSFKFEFDILHGKLKKLSIPTNLVLISNKNPTHDCILNN